MTHEEWKKQRENDPNRIKMICKKCNIVYDHELPGPSAICVHCLSKLIPLENALKCPTCGSINIEKISSLKRAAHGYAFGIFSSTARSQFECKNCGYKW